MTVSPQHSTVVAGASAYPGIKQLQEQLCKGDKGVCLKALLQHDIVGLLCSPLIAGAYITRVYVQTCMPCDPCPAFLRTIVQASCALHLIERPDFDSVPSSFERLSITSVISTLVWLQMPLMAFKHMQSMALDLSRNVTPALAAP